MNDADQLPRADLAERGYVGSFLAWPERAAELFALGVADTDLVDEFHQAIFRTLRRQFDQGGINVALARAELKPPASTSGDFTKDYFDDLAELAPTTAYAPAQAAEIVEARRKRQWYDHHHTLAGHALNGWTSEQLERENEAFQYDCKREREARRPRDKFTFADLQREYPTLNPPVVDGLFREGETVNLISISKVGKSWLAYNLALSIITGQPWLGRFSTSRGKVLLIDNELHRCTLAHRIPTVANALEILPGEYQDDLHVWPLRGNLRSLADLEADFAEIESDDFAENESGEFKAIIMDSKYRFAIAGVSENDNAAETTLYNQLDRIAERTKAALILIHHTSKGGQSDKRVTDVGAGAGAQSRAADCHIILREHESPGVVVLDAAVRSFAPVEPLALRWDFPLWLPAEDIDPGKLKGRLTHGEQRQTDKDREAVNKIVDALRKDGPGTPRQLRPRTGLSRDRLQRLLDWMAAEGHVIATETIIRGNQTHEYALAESED